MFRAVKALRHVGQIRFLRRLDMVDGRVVATRPVGLGVIVLAAGCSGCYQACHGETS